MAAGGKTKTVPLQVQSFCAAVIATWYSGLGMYNEKVYSLPKPLKFPLTLSSLSAAFTALLVFGHERVRTGAAILGIVIKSPGLGLRVQAKTICLV